MKKDKLIALTEEVFKTAVHREIILNVDAPVLIAIYKNIESYIKKLESPSTSTYCTCNCYNKSLSDYEFNLHNRWKD